MTLAQVPQAWRGRTRRVVVTGCAGFLGSHLVDALLAAGHDVLGVDAFTDYYDPAQKRHNLSRALGHASFQLLEADLNGIDLAQLLSDREVCFHLSAQAGVRASWGHEFQIYLDQNVRATQNLLEACARVRSEGVSFQRLVYSSSSSIYGNQDHYPVDEEALPRPFSPYGVTKLAAEHLCALYAANHGVPCSSLRYFTVYGPRQRPDMAFRRFVEAARQGRPWHIHGDGTQTRDFTYVDDVVRANLLAADDAAPYGVYNIAGGSRISLNGALELLRESIVESGLAREVQVEFGPSVPGDVRHTYAQVDRAKRDLGFEASTSLRDGLRAEVNWVLEGETA